MILLLQVCDGKYVMNIPMRKFKILSNFVYSELRTQNSETLFRYIGSWNKIHYMVI